MSEVKIDKYVYTIGYYDYDDSDFICLIHSKKFTKTELEELILKLADEPLKEKLNKRFSDFVRFGSIYEDIADKLCSDYGFERLNFTVEFGLTNVNLLESNDLYVKKFDEISKRLRAKAERICEDLK
jgi:hypothetical protein